LDSLTRAFYLAFAGRSHLCRAGLLQTGVDAPRCRSGYRGDTGTKALARRVLGATGRKAMVGGEYHVCTFRRAGRAGSGTAYPEPNKERPTGFAGRANVGETA